MFDPDGTVYQRLSGVRINLKTGRIVLVCVPAKRSEPHLSLFDVSDIEEVFAYRIGSTFFSLDPLNSHTRPLHPCQTMRFDKKNVPHHIDFVKTMFFTDYLLKFFTTGTEVSSEFPFDMRSTQCGLLERLPAHLRKLVEPLHGDQPINESAHRFWIESSDVPYKVTTSGNGDEEINLYFGDVKMKVKKHLLVKDNKGNLIDAPEDENDESAEGIFAKQFTKHYDEIGSYFPEFLRLKELTKLATAQNIISLIIKEQKKK